MKFNLEKEDLIHLVRGVNPYYSIFDDHDIKPYGGYLSNKWQWNHFKLNELNRDQLFKLYKKCKNSWKDEKT